MGQWSHKDINQKKIQNQCQGSTNISTNSLSEAPHLIFEKFDSQNAGFIEICNQSNKYEKSIGNHTFNLTLEKLKSFVAILLLSDYNELPRQEIYWERKEDCHSVLASTLMTKNKFKEWKKHLHIADNDDLDPEDRFANVRPFLMKLQPIYKAVTEEVLKNRKVSK